MEKKCPSPAVSYKFAQLAPFPTCSLGVLPCFRNFSFLFLFLQKRDKSPEKVLLLAAMWGGLGGDRVCIARGYTSCSWGGMSQAGSAMSLFCPTTYPGHEVTQRRIILLVLRRLLVIGPCEGQLHSLAMWVFLCALGIILPGAQVQSLNWSRSLLG